MKYLSITTVSLLIATTMICCSSVDTDNIIYKINRVFKYRVVVIDGKTHDTTYHKINLKVKEREFPQVFFEQTAVEWHYIDEKQGNSHLIERTGVCENKTNVYLHPPRMSYMSFTQIAPHPDVTFPLRVGNTSEGELKIVKGWDSLDGKTIKNYCTVKALKDEKIQNNVYKDCYLIEGENTNYVDELGVYHVKFWFNKDFGFVKLEYHKPDSTIVAMELMNVKS